MVSTKKRAAETCEAAAGSHLGGNIKIPKQELSRPTFGRLDERAHRVGAVVLLAGNQILLPAS